jgi:hypothetical protein
MLCQFVEKFESQNNHILALPVFRDEDRPLDNLNKTPDLI